MNSENLQSVQQTVVNLVNRVERAQTETRIWQVVAIMLPVLATAGLGFAVERWKTSIQEQIDRRSQELSTRLALTEEFYRRKLTAHEQLYKSIVTAVNSLKDAQHNTPKKTEAIKSLADLYENYTMNGLYISPDLLSALRQFEEAATNMPLLYPPGTIKITDVEKCSDQAQQQMAKDLQLSRFNTVQ